MLLTQISAKGTSWMIICFHVERAEDYYRCLVYEYEDGLKVFQRIMKNVIF